MPVFVYLHKYCRFFDENAKCREENTVQHNYIRVKILEGPYSHTKNEIMSHR